MKQVDFPNTKNRRSFLRNSLAAGTALAGAGALAENKLLAVSSNGLTDGDAAVLKFVAAAELIEADIWIQYAELGGKIAGSANPYQEALERLDDDVPQYIASNTLDEISHADFLNAYLVSKGEEAVNFDRFRTLPSSQADGAKDMGRLTNLMQLKIDTSWYTRYRSADNPDHGGRFPQAIPGLFGMRVTAIPRTNADFGPADHVQVIANNAAFHFATIEQGGSSLYATLGHKVTSLEVLRIMFSIGGDEVAHFLEWMDFAGNAVKRPVAPVRDPQTGLTYPDFGSTKDPLLKPDLIFPVPCEFISPKLPRCAVIRPTASGHIDAEGAARSFIAQGLLIGQPDEFSELLLSLAKEADAAKRELD